MNRHPQLPGPIGGGEVGDGDVGIVADLLGMQAEKQVDHGGVARRSAMAVTSSRQTFLPVAVQMSDRTTTCDIR